ncbi:SEFIR domain-containing protein [Sunxiuqinia elliptica]|uniref:SEFIR domain-containing protein n=2 Tax=Sunxiuqinia elliptica TaxID=655355 RepID=A0A4R6GQS7_9BACT|nr:SEFIR domain-containing protein [Sunxiuqinia elliptica]
MADGVDLFFDRFDLQIGSNNTYFMEKIDSAQKVILIMTKDYKIKADNRKNGIGYEYQIISSIISKSISSNRKFLPILRNGSPEESIPTFLQSFLFLDMRNNNTFEKDYITLLRSIYEEPEFKKPQIGKKPDFVKLSKAADKKTIKSTDIGELFKLGRDKKFVHKNLGEPQYDYGLIESFWSHGIQIYYNRHSENVDGVLLKRLPSGVTYEGNLLGVSLGSSFAEVKSILGNPINWGLPDAYTSFAFYHIDKRYLTLAIWRNKPDKDDSDFKIGSIYGIAYCEECSALSCEPIVAITIEDIRAGRNSKFLEKGLETFHNVDPNASFFHEPYDMVPAQFGIFGGYFVTVAFRESKTILVFWLYDLGWQSFVVRMIANRGMINENK